MLLTDLWGAAPSTNDRFILLALPEKGKFKAVKVRDAAHAQALAEELSRRGQTVYFSPGEFVGRRRQADAVSVPAFWVDLDVEPGNPKKYPDLAVALKDLLGWCKKESVPNPTHIVHSGYGAHVYWILDAPVPPESWKPAAQRLKQALRLAGVKQDPTRTADEASVLRIPGTHNHKDPTNPRDVTVLYASDRRVTLEDFARTLPAVGPQRVVEPQPASEWAVETQLPPGDAAVIGERCAQMRQVRDTAGRVDEPHWRAALSVLKRCEGGDQLIHEWSKGDPRYDAQETQRKADGTGGPMTCASFDEANPGGCAGCSYAGKITSPILIQPAAPGPTPEQVAQEPWKLGRIGRYTIVSGGIWHTPRATEEDPAPETAKIADFPMWVVEVRERVKLHDGQNEGAGMLIEWVSLDGRVKRGVMRQSELFDTAAFRNWMANSGIAIGIRDFKHMTYFIGQLTAHNIKSRGVVKYHETLGWYDDGFVIGDQLITKDGAEPSMIQAGSNEIAKLTKAPGGDLNQWVAGMRALNDPRYAKQAFALMASFGSPLLELAGLQSAVISLAGQSGAGKTMIMSGAMSVWGNPKYLYQGSGSTAKAIEKQLGINRHVPYGVDEISLWKVDRLAHMLYLAANGSGDAKLNRDRSTQDVGHWANVTYVTTNKAILDHSQQALSEAHRSRVLELFFTTPIPREVAAPIIHASEHHYGTAAVPFMQAVQKLKDKIPALLQQTMDKLVQEHNIPDVHRFSLWTIAAAKVGGSIAKALGLVSFDLDTVIGAAVAAIEDNVGNTQDSDTVAREAICEWLSTSAENISVWPEGAICTTATVRNPVARLLRGNRVAVNRARCNETLVGAAVSPRAAKATFSYPVMTDKPKRVRLSPGTPAVFCYIFDTRHLGFDTDELENKDDDKEIHSSDTTDG